ncbi:MAG: putative DsbA family dithiol-disulfide isomerase [Arenicella sp.]|jgi:predicted DsbA family dithiol-disulfide isomerase
MHTIDIISDVSCPWCIIGYRSLLSALEQLDAQDSVKINWRPFELNPTMPAEGQDRVEHLQQKYGLTEEQSNANRQNLIDRGLSVGYQFEFVENGRVYNTFNAHRLIHWAQQHDLQTELKLALFDLYFQQAGNPSSDQDLLSCVEKVGLPVPQAKDILESDKFKNEVRADQQLSQQQSISSVPAFIFNHKYLVSGGQPKEVFIEAIEALNKEAAVTA